MLHYRELTERIIGLAIEVHRPTGPGLLESFYVAALGRELERAGIPAIYKGEALHLGFRGDILEIKEVPAPLPVHDMQVQTYLSMSGLPVGLLLNFHALRLKDGLRQLVG